MRSRLGRAMIKFLLKNRKRVLILYLLLSILGLISFYDIKTSLLPEIQRIELNLKTRYANASSIQVEQIITKPILERINGISGIESAIGRSGSSISEIQLIVQDKNKNTEEVLREKLESIREFFPREVERTTIERFNPNSEAFFQIGFKQKSINSGVGLREYLERVWKKELERVDGIASIMIVGGEENKIKISLDREKLNRTGIQTQVLIKNFQNENRNIPIGIIEDNKKEVNLGVKNKLDTIESISKFQINIGNQNRNLSEFAQIEYETESQDCFLGKDKGVIFSFQLESGKNLIEVSQRLRNKLSEISKTEKDRVEYLVLLDESEFINSAMNSLKISLLLGGILSFIVLYLFVKDFRAPITLVTLIPLNLILTILCFKIFNLSFNLLSLGGLSLGIGMLFDSSNVVLSGIERNLDNDKNIFDSIEKGINEVYTSILSANFTTLLVFLPLGFKSVGKANLFSEMAISISISLTISLVLSLTFTPIIYSFFPKRIIESSNNDEIVFLSKLNHNIDYNRKKFYLSIFIYYLISILSSLYIRYEFFPELKKSNVQLNLNLPVELNEKSKKRIILELKEILEEKYQNFSLQATSIDEVKISIFEKLDAKEIETIIEQIKKFPLNKIQQSSMDEVGRFLNESNSDLTVIISDEYELIERISEFKELANNSNLVKRIDGFGDEKIDEIIFYPDQNKLILSEIDFNTLLEEISITISKTEFLNDSIYFKINDQYPSLDEVKKIEVLNKRRELVRLGALGRFESTQSINERYIIGGRSGVKFELFLFDSEKGKELANLLREKNFEVESKTDRRVSGYIDFSFTLGVSFILLYLFLSFQFSSFRIGGIIILAIPLIYLGIFLPLAFTGNSFNISVFLAMLILSGIVVDSSVLFFEYFFHSTENHKLVEKISRPILVNSTTTIFGLMPQSLGIGDGNEFYSPLSISMIFGIILSVLFTLIVLPRIAKEIKL
ncbi:MAG: efflux RND transporter permease subunit [Leptospiraceae bacterium]|nr:efflux RND transporter permease subunit [Leptospiraceae bacterium]